MSGCCVPGCGNRDKTRMPFHTLPRNEKLRNLWLEKIRNPKLFGKMSTALRHMQVCSVHFEDKQYRTALRQKLNVGAFPVLFLPEIKEVSAREFVRGFDSSILTNDTTVNSNKSLKSVESNENDFQTKSDKIVTPAPILFVSSSADYREEEDVLKTSNKQPDTDCDPLKKRFVQKPRCTGQCKVDLESSVQRERNFNLVVNANCALQTQVNKLQSENRRLDRRVKSMKILLRHYKTMHAR